MRRSILVLVALLLALAILAPAPGGAAEFVVSAASFQFVPSVVAVPQGSTLRFVNADAVEELDGAGHNVTISLTRKSATIHFGQTSLVSGVNTLAAGTYPFVCTVHPDFMTGQLRVV